jgi:uncharacterized membrane protein
LPHAEKACCINEWDINDNLRKTTTHLLAIPQCSPAAGGFGTRYLRSAVKIEQYGGAMEKKNKIITIDELRKLRKPIHNVNIKHRESLSYLEKIAVKVTEHVGSMGFFIIIFVWTVLWLGWNILAPRELRFDPVPAFVLWLFLSNMIQIFLMPLIMIGQNLQGRHAEKRAESDYEVNVKSEREIEAILMHLEHQNDLIIKILKNTEKGKR